MMLTVISKAPPGVNLSISKKKFVFNSLTGDFDLVSVDNFSFDYIASGKTVDVPVNQQMFVYEVLTVDGVLNIDGSVVLVN